MFANSMQGGMCMGMPDVCKVPAPPAPPIPTPFPNQAMCQVADGSTCSEKVLICMMKAFNLDTKIPQSNGDEAGVAGGVVSGKIMGPASFIKGSMKVFIEGSPSVRMLDPTKQNGDNANVPGMTLQPSQTKVLVLS